MASDCILALDLGTTAFKAAPVDENGLCAPPTVIQYALDYGPDGSVTCDPERYFRCALRAIGRAAKAAAEADRRVTAIGISSQAQTYIALDESGKPVQPAIVWTDGRATQEAAELEAQIPDVAALCGFRHLSPLQFLPKVAHFARQQPETFASVQKFLLLNEYILYRLTGLAYGDETNQGMGGFYDITARNWSETALQLTGLTPSHFAHVDAAAAFCRPLKSKFAQKLGLPLIPLFSCGNDQSVGAAGAGLEQEGDILCNFGTAMVLYAPKQNWTPPACDFQITGIDPLTNRYFLLALESECGNVVEWLTGLLSSRRSIARWIADALQSESGSLPQIAIGAGKVTLAGLPIGSPPETLVRALLTYYADRFTTLLDSVSDNHSDIRLFAGGGLSRSPDWLAFLARKRSLSFHPTETEHPGLLGIARILQK